ncbi:hypothetical protein [Chlorobaculum limnaeum]|uniref:hypothetical protein n=1 Tax=Chlorobaculum limnaeum TaxID=274537 RepID=UPI0012EE2C10|nr:hypothetical protein [Chlorobaculum limnaeum]
MTIGDGRSAHSNSFSVPDSAVPVGEPKRCAMMPITSASDSRNRASVCFVISS